MTGTSIDGLDVALVSVEGKRLAMKASIVRTLSRSLGDLSPRLRHLAQQQSVTARETAMIAHDFALLHLDLLTELIGDDRVDLVVVHGQTVYHSPPYSWQLIDPVPISMGLEVPVLYNLRAADLAAGGQGAPISPVADFILFRDQSESRCVVNLGGFCNITALPPCRAFTENDLQSALTEVTGRDVCVCNHFLDHIARRLFRRPFDIDGRLAAGGNVKEELVEEFCSLFDAQAAMNRSLGSGDELSDIIERNSSRYLPRDLARSACAAIAATIAKNVGDLDRVILSGGGVLNQTLVNEIQNQFDVYVDPTDEFGIPVTHREAAVMAILGALCQDRMPITLSQVTGARFTPLSGCWVLPGKGNFSV